jgi:hypothetical protein
MNKDFWVVLLSTLLTIVFVFVMVLIYTGVFYLLWNYSIVNIFPSLQHLSMRKCALLWISIAILFSIIKRPVIKIINKVK